MSDEIKARFSFVDEKLNDIKADVLEIRKGILEANKTASTLVQISGVHAKILEQQHEQLREHIRRTDLLEQRVEQVSQEIRKDLRPVEDHVKFLSKSGKALKWMVGILAGIAAIVKVFFL